MEIRILRKFCFLKANTYLLEQLLELLMIVAEVSIVEHASDVQFVVKDCWLLLPCILHIPECLAGLVS